MERAIIKGVWSLLPVGSTRHSVALTCVNASVCFPNFNLCVLFVRIMCALVSFLRQFAQKDRIGPWTCTINRFAMPLWPCNCRAGSERIIMRHAETVTFGGSGIDRAAHLRADPAALIAMMATARVLPLWRGKPLTVGDLDMVQGLGWLSATHAIFNGGETPIFLGRDAGIAYFAQDISAWAPPTDGAPVDSFLDASVQHHPALPTTHGFRELRGLLTALNARDAELAATARALLIWHANHGFCAKCGAASHATQGGWQRSCPACNTPHFPRTDSVVIMLVTHGNRLLLGRSPGWPVGMYSCLAGFIEPGETIEAAVRRETVEEAGVTVGSVRYLASQPWPFPASLMIGCHAEATSDTITLDPAELEHACWVTREDMVTVMAGEHPQIKPARKGAIAHFLIANWLSDSLL
jgi:NAD+ diphosphatase